MKTIESLFKEYAKYIVEDKIPNYYYYRTDLILLGRNIYKYSVFLDEYKKYNNNTRIFFKGIYYYCRKEYTKMLFLIGNIDESNIYTLLALYYCKIKDFNLMKKYLLMAVKLNNVNAMYYMGYYYYHIDEDYDLMKKYYLMAIDMDNTDAMNNLSYYYLYIEKNYDLVKKYYLMAIELNCPNAMYSLGLYYNNIDVNFDLMKKYYIMAINFNVSSASYCLRNYCNEIEKNPKNYYRYVFYPRILTLILSTNKYKNWNNINLFLPEELLTYIFDEYISNERILDE